MMVHNEFKEMIPTYVLSALDAVENRAFGEHLSQCAECQRELENWQATAAMLSLDAQPIEPSPAVRERIFSAIRAEATQVNVEDKSKSNVVQFKSTGVTPLGNYSSLWAIAAGIMLLIAAASLFVLWQQNKSYNRQREELAKELETTKSELDQSKKILQVTMTPGARLNELGGTKEAPGASAKLAYDKSGHAMLMAHGLPPAPSGKEYQLWFIVGSNPMPGKTFAPDRSGTGMLEDQIPEAARDSAVFAITLEKKGGELKPTGAIYLSSSL